MTTHDNLPTGADGADDEIADLVEELEEDSITPDDVEEDDDDESDDDDDTVVEEQDALNLDSLPEQVRSFVLDLIIPRAKEAAGRYKEAHTIVKSADNVLTVAAERWGAAAEQSDDAELAAARERYDALHKEADAIAEEWQTKIKETLSESQDATKVDAAKEAMKAARGDFEAQVKFANEQLLAPANVKGDIRTVLPTLPVIRGKGGSTGSSGPKPRVDRIDISDDNGATWKPVTIKVTNSKGVEQDKSSFTALRLKLNTLSEGTVDVTDLHKAWQDTAGKSNMADITTVVEFSWPVKSGNVMVRVTPTNK